MTDDLPSSRRRTWPADREPAEEDRIETQCEACGIEWWIHKKLASRRLRCECGEWIDVPGSEPEPQLPTTRDAPVPRRQVQRTFGKTADYSRPPIGDEIQHEISTSAPLPDNALRHATLDTRRRWKNRGVLELAGVVAAFWLPPTLFYLLIDDRESLIYLPLTDLISAVLILLVGLSAAHYMYSGVKQTTPNFYLEAVPIALVLAWLAILWTDFLTQGFEGGNLLRDLRNVLGLPWALVLIGVFPAVFEELAFRGLLQGRLGALYGRNSGILLQGIAFAFAHGVTFALPFHVFGGFYLGWLRARSDSLYPGMLLHFIYNATLVIEAGGG